MSQEPPSTQPSQEMKFYQRYYEAVNTSQANAQYCQRLFGANFCQHGFAEVAHLDHALQVSGLQPGQKALDLGCGNGLITEYLCDRSGAHFIGIDFIAEAIRQANHRTQSKQKALHFQVMDMAQLDFPPDTFDAVFAVDTLYFAPEELVLPRIFSALKPGGCLVAFWSQGADPQTPLAVFDRATLPPDCTELGVALKKRGWAFQTWDYSQADYQHAQRKLEISQALRAEFEAEGNLFLCDNHIEEAHGVIEAFEAQAHARYLYRVEKPAPGVL